MANGILCRGNPSTITDCIIRNNNSNGIYCKNAAVVIDRSTIGPNNTNYGLYLDHSAANAADSIFSKSGGYGIYAGDANIALEQCDINDNLWTGIQCASSAANIQRCNIQRNGG
jgi:hypothetical protein